jgi:riboflavin-specific deaminase-like protein
VLPYALLSCAVSLDGYLDDASADRLVLSNEADLDEVDEARAGCDAILVGANTIRRDNPRLLVRSAARRAARRARGRQEGPARGVLTTGAALDPGAHVFTTGGTERLVYCATPALAAAGRLGAGVQVVDAGDPVDLARVLADLAARGTGRLLVEGGARVLTGFLAAGLADELRLAVAPFFVGDSRAPRFVLDAALRWRPGHPARLLEARRLGEVAVLRYALSARCAG